MTQIALLILAAGASSRMQGRDKLLTDAGGEPLLARVTRRALATGLPTYVTLPDLTHPRARLIQTTDAHPVPVPDWATGMSASIRTGVAALSDQADAVMILPGDMPDLTTGDYLEMAADYLQNPGQILRAVTSDGAPGHPVIFPADLFGALKSLSGDTGAQPVVRANADRLRRHPLSGTRARCDLDTPEDWAIWQAAQHPTP